MPPRTKSTHLTSRDYWDSTYDKRGDLCPVSTDGSRNICVREILSLKNKIGLDEKAVLEIGGGGSPWLPFLAKEHPSSTFTCLDYSEVGVKRLEAHARKESLSNIRTVLADMFAPPPEGERYDFVFSHGVVEHFFDLPAVLFAHSQYLKKEGFMLTIIPNMSGSVGLLTKILNRSVYDIHIPHNIESLLKGHKEASLVVVESGYLCSNNFGVLSSCVARRPSFVWCVYASLSIVSRIIWMFEEKVAYLPRSRLFSPYIYVIAQRSADRSE